jgi:hypothetical protein
MFWLTSCMSQNEQIIQGKWANGNAHYWAEWNFNAGMYSYYFDNGATSIYETGRYSIVKSTEDTIDLELFNREGGIGEMMEERVQVGITISQEGSIKINGGDFFQVSESSLLALETAMAPMEKQQP